MDDDFNEDLNEEQFAEDITEESMQFNEGIEEINEEEQQLEKVNFANIPINIHIEMGKVDVSLEELQKMIPGSKLPININPRLVNLTTNGKTIGRGELIEIGDTVGVKIIELY